MDALKSVSIIIGAKNSFVESKSFSTFPKIDAIRRMYKETPKAERNEEKARDAFSNFLNIC